MTRRPLARPRHPAARAVPRRAGRALIGLAAALALLALLVGVPYGLAHWVGWPLPHHVPTLTEIKATLTGPFTDRILLDTLACLCWLVWAVFVIDTVRAVPDAAHDARWPAASPRPPNRNHGDGRRTGPLRGLATVLLVAVLSGLFSLRPHPGIIAGHAGPVGPEARPTTVATSVPVDLVPTRAARAESGPATARVAADRVSGTRTVTVRSPHDGIHDSLWRIAARCLGDGARWPEIYRLNRGLPQPDGESLQTPSLIQPGWVLRLPTTTPAADSGSAPNHTPPSPRPRTPHPPAPTTRPPTPDGSPPPPVTPPPSPSPRSTDRPAVHATGRGGGVDLGEEALVGLGLAATVSAALLVTRRRRRRYYVPGSGRRDDLLPVPPIVRTLHLAHLRATDQAATPAAPAAAAHDSADAQAETADSEPHRDRATVPSRTLPTAVVVEPERELPAAVQAGQEIAVDLAALHGLGLVGPGALGAARALLLHVLTRHDSGSGPAGPAVLIPADTADALQLSDPGRLRLVPDLGAALDEAETVLLRQARLAVGNGMPASGGDGRGLVVITSVPADTRRLQAIVDTGTATGVGAILLGQWRPGSSLYVAADGAVTATSPGAGEPLRGSRLFHLSAPDAAEVLTLLRAADQPPDNVDQFTSDPADASAEDSQPFGSPEQPPPRSDPPPRVEPAGVAPHEAPSPQAEASTRAATRGAVATKVAQTSRHAADAGSAAPDPAHRHGGAPGSRGDRAGSEDGSYRAVLRLAVLGPVRLTWTPASAAASRTNDATDVGSAAVSAGGIRGVDITGAVSARLRELLVLLALHPDGLTRDRLADTLWPDTSAERPFATLNKNLARLRHTIAAATGGEASEVTRTSGDRYLLDPRVVQTDFAVFSDALAARRKARDDQQRAVAYRKVVAAYLGELAEGLPAEWLETAREATRRDAVDAATGLSRLLVSADARAALDLMETARAFDPYNEAIYRDIMRLQRRLAQPDAIERTLALLMTRLSELEETPCPETLALVERLGMPTPAGPAQSAR